MADTVSRFFIDETAVETRLARLMRGRLIELKLFPNTAPAQNRPQVGDLYLARVTKAARGMNGVFVDLGVAGEGFLRTRAMVPEGEFVLARVSQAAHATKLPVLSRTSDSNNEHALDRRARRVASAPGAVLQALAWAKPRDLLLIDGDKTWRDAQAQNLAIEVDKAALGLFEREGIEAQIDMALEPVVSLASGGRLIIEETNALTAIDVDVASAARSADVNAQAAEEIAYQIPARRLAGNLIIDFAQVRRGGDLNALKTLLATTAQSIGLELEIGAGGRTGLLQVARSRSEAPLSAVLTQAGVTHTAVPVVLNLEAQTAALARAVRLTSSRVAGSLGVRVNPALGNWLTRAGGRAAWTAVVSATPAPLHLKPDVDLSLGAFEVDRGEKGGV